MLNTVIGKRIHEITYTLDKVITIRFNHLVASRIVHYLVLFTDSSEIIIIHSHLQLIL